MFMAVVVAFFILAFYDAQALTFFVAPLIYALAFAIPKQRGVFAEFLVINPTDSEEDKAGKEAINKAFEKSQAEANNKLKTAEEKYEKALADQLDLLNKKLEEAQATGQSNLDEKERELKGMLAELNRAKISDDAKRTVSMVDAIFDTLKENEEMLKDWNKNKKSQSFEVKAVGTIGVPAGGVAPEFQPIVPIPHEMEHARSVIPVSPTTSDLIRYIQMSVKEGAIGVVAAGAAKPAFDYTPTVKDAYVRKIAGNITLTDEFLQDVVGSRDFIASELPQALLDVEDYEIFKGPGTGEHLLGLMIASQNLILPKGSVTVNSNKWDQLAAALAQIRRNKRAANAAWLSPEDFMELLINKTTIGEYTYPMMMRGIPLAIGNVPILQSAVFLQNEALVGDFARGTRIFQRSAPLIKYSTEHANNFTENLTTVVIEERIALPIFTPDAFIHIDFNGIAS